VDLDALVATRERGWMTAPLTAATISNALREGDEMWAFKMALQGRDHLRDLLREAPDLSGSWEAAPRSTGSSHWDSLLAGLVGCGRHGPRAVLGHSDQKSPDHSGERADWQLLWSWASVAFPQKGPIGTYS
jgi:hypothetical protein